MAKKLFKITALLLSVCLMFSACSPSTAQNEPENTAAQATENAEDDGLKGTDETMTNTEKNPRVRLTLADGGVIEMELYPDIAPLSCDLFLTGVETGYYDGLVFHRAVPGFMIQGGSPNGDGIGGMDKAIKGEFASNGFNNTLSHKRGVVSLARTNDPNSASGQFFIMHDDGEFLDGSYAAFGEVTSGMEYVDEIAEMPTSGEMLIEKPVIESMVLIED